MISAPYVLEINSKTFTRILKLTGKLFHAFNFIQFGHLILLLTLVIVRQCNLSLGVHVAMMRLIYHAYYVQREQYEKNYKLISMVGQRLVST